MERRAHLGNHGLLLESFDVMTDAACSLHAVRTRIPGKELRAASGAPECDGLEQPRPRTAPGPPPGMRERPTPTATPAPPRESAHHPPPSCPPGQYGGRLVCAPVTQSGGGRRFSTPKAPTLRGIRHAGPTPLNLDAS